MRFSDRRQACTPACKFPAQRNTRVELLVVLDPEMDDVVDESELLGEVVLINGFGDTAPAHHALCHPGVAVHSGFANDGKSIELSFRDPSGNGAATDLYTVHFANSDNYAIAAISKTSNGFEVTAVDYGAEIAKELESVDVGFTAADVALPEGTYIENGKLVATDDAPKAVQDVLVESGIAEQEEQGASIVQKAYADEGSASAGSGGSGDAALDYMKDYNERQKRFKNYDAVAGKGTAARRSRR